MADFQAIKDSLPEDAQQVIDQVRALVKRLKCPVACLALPLSRMGIQLDICLIHT